MIVSFDRFMLEIPRDCALECSHPGSCDQEVAEWAPKIERPKECTPKALAAELEEYGAWDMKQLADDAENWQRIVWIAAGQAREETP